MEIHKQKNVRLVPWQLWTITSVVILCEIVILHGKFVVLSCAYCKREFCVPSIILVKAGSMQIMHIVTCSPSLTENDSRLLKNSIGNSDGEWIFCRRKQAEVTLFFQVTRIRKIRKLCEATGEEHHGSRICIISVVGSDG